MEVNIVIVVILAIALGVLFFIADFFEHEHHQLHISVIAGISLAYFFLVLLPEVSEGMPEYPLHLRSFEYLFILMGFAFVHVSEKFIIQKVESNAQRRIRKLLKKEKGLEIVEHNIELLINKELLNETLDVDTLKHLAETLSNLNEQGADILDEIEQYKMKIQDHINKDLDELRFFTNFAYHFLVGIILIGLLTYEFLSGILFFFFAWFRAIVANRMDSHLLFTDLEIQDTIKYHDTPLKRFASASATIIGIVIGLVTEFILPIQIELEMIYILYSGMSGVILYTIVREVIPEKEKGKPLYFIIGAVSFTLLVILLGTLEILI